MSKKFALLILSLLLFHLTKAQSVSINERPSSHDSVKNVVDSAIYASVEKEPEFAKGGPAGFNRFLVKNVKFSANDRQIGTVGKVITTFVVEKDGRLSNIKNLRSPDKSMAEALENALKLSPPWNPGMQNGQPVRTQFTISFAFSLANN